MKGPELATPKDDIRLVEPDVDRDSLQSAQWLEGSLGRNTLRLMGVPEDLNKPTTLEQEQERIKGFIKKSGQLNWMIEYQGKVVGTVWADLEPTDRVLGPAVHIMIGDSEVRDQGIGFSAASTVVEYLEKQGEKYIYSRHRVENTRAKRLLDKLGFSDFGPTYTDEAGFEWQNVLKLTERAEISASSS